jgi:hypothetical protein
MVVACSRTPYFGGDPSNLRKFACLKHIGEHAMLVVGPAIEGEAFGANAAITAAP